MMKEEFDTWWKTEGKFMSPPKKIAFAAYCAGALAGQNDAVRYRFVRMNRLWLKSALTAIAAPEFDRLIDDAMLTVIAKAAE